MQNVKSEVFQVERITSDLITWIQAYFEQAGEHTKAVIGLSGGKDSSIAASLLVKALGKERVFGVLMPQGEQFDIDCSQKIANHLGIEYTTINIKDSVDALMQGVSGGVEAFGYDALSSVTTFNTPARVRMSILYGVAGTLGARVVNTCNLSEDWVGYATKFGDGAGDFSLLMHLTVSEVKAIGTYLGVPLDLVEKTPIDGLCGKSDEENLGFTYEALDAYIREGICEDEKIKQRIDYLRKINMHKLLPMAHYDPKLKTIED